MKSNVTFALTAIALAAVIASCNKNPVAPNNSVTPVDAKNIDSLVASVPDFQPAPTWSTRVDSMSTDTTSTVDTSGTQVDSTTWLTQNVSYSASADPSTYMMFNPQASVLWPGNLVQGNSIASGVPNSIPISNRAPGNISLAILSGDSAGTANKFYRTINQFQFSTVNQAMNSILAGYSGGTPAKYSYSMEQVYSASQINFNLSLGYTGPSVNGSGEFGLSFSRNKTYFAVQLTQQFFTMVYDDPQGASGAFGPGFTASELAPYTGPGNPVCYISSVTYGRIYILIYETTASADSLQAALNFAYNGGVASGSVNSTAAFDKVMSQTTVQVTQIGGDPQAGLTAATALSYSAINSFMTRGADFSPNNIGQPISYTVKYLKDASLVRMNSVMQYTVSQKTPISTSTGYTKSPISIFVSDLSITQNNISEPQGGCKVVVGLTNVITGHDSVVWTSPINNGQGGSTLYDGTSGWFDFGSTAMNAGTDLQLNFTAPQLQMDNNPNEKVWVDFWINDYNGNTGQRNWAYQRMYLQYDDMQQTWVRSGPQGSSATQMPVSTPDVSGTFNFTVTISGVQLQQ